MSENPIPGLQFRAAAWSPPGCRLVFVKAEGEDYSRRLYFYDDGRLGFYWWPDAPAEGLRLW